jgi:hypothetical protein
MYVLPIEIQGAFSPSTKEYIGPVPAFETLRIEDPNDSSAASLTCKTKGSEGLVLAAASP